MLGAIRRQNNFSCRPGFRLYQLILALLFIPGCGGLGGEPRIIATMPPAPTRIIDIGLPSTHPDLLQGAQIFNQHCTSCHGVTGRGDGQLVLSGQLTDPPPDFTDPRIVRGQSPVEWFSTITNGRLEKLMPPWLNSLSESQRWSVTLYTYTMNYSPEQLESGQAAWRANCAECHGETGVGDGPRASELNLLIPNLTQPEALVGVSDAVMFETITNGKGEGMPGFRDKLSENERWNIVTYTRSLSTANIEAIDKTAPATTPDAQIASALETLGTVTGQVTNATSGSTALSGLVITLHILDSQINEQTRETVLAEDGTFTFTDVPIRDDRAYVTSTAYENRTFDSSLRMGDTSIAALDLPITVYDLTDDRSAISITDLLIQISASGDRLDVAQVIKFRNSSDKLYTRNEQVGSGRYASVIVPLPRDAQILETGDRSGRYLFMPEITALVDTRPVLPGRDHLVHVLYTLPYRDGGLIELPLEYRLDGPVRLLLGPESLSLSSPQLPALGSQTLGGIRFQSYGGTLALPLGDMLRYVISGSATTNQTAPLSTPNTLAYALMAFGSLSLLIAAVIYYLGRRMPTQSNQEQVNAMIIEQIAELDDLHEKGLIDLQAYQQRRDNLKERLTKLMSDK